MTNKILNSLFGLLAVVVPFAGVANAENFEFLNYTPPSGWTNKAVPNGKAYQRASGIGLISIYQSERESAAISGDSAVDSISRDFAKIWRARIEPTLPGIAPQPQVLREGGYQFAVGAKQVKDSQGAVVTITLTAISAQGRVIGVLSMSAGDDVFREVTAFFESVKVLPEKRDAISAEPPPNSGSVSSGGIQVDYQVPPGLTAKNDNGMIRLMPPRLENNKCAYWISLPRPSQGSLDEDARKAALEIPSQIQGRILNSEWFRAIRGITPGGWKYSLYSTDIHNSVGTMIGNVIALAFPAGAGQVNIVWGVGNSGSNCYLLDPNFIRLFHSLNPRTGTSDRGQAFASGLKGHWRDITRSSMSGGGNMFLTEYKFMENGRYESGRGSVVTQGNLETTSAGVSDGSFKLSGNRLTITSDSRNVSNFRVRLYEEYFARGWRRKMSLFDEETNLEKEYFSVEN